MTREIILDTETTGLNVREGDRIIEIGCVELVNRTKTNRTFHSYINPQREVSKDATAIHGITTEFLKDKPIFSEVVNKFLDFIEDSILVIHNASFDVSFINYELSSLSLPIIDNKRIVDSLLLARKKYPGAQNSLDALCKRFRVNLSSRIKHGALIDAELLTSVYLNLQDSIQCVIPLSNDNKNHSIGLSNNRVLRPARAFSLSDEELEKHSEFIQKNIQHPIWGKLGNKS